MAARSRAETPAPDSSPSFDDRLQRLEAIVAELEGGDLGLEGSIARYQEGTELLKQCKALLDGYRQRVQELTAEAEGTLKPYAKDPDAGAEG